MTPYMPHRGYIALISVLTLSFMLMTFGALASENGLRARWNTIALEDRIAAAQRARACASAALLTLAQDRSYRFAPNGETMQLSPELICTIEEASEMGDRLFIKTSAQVGTSVSRLRVEAEITPLYEIIVTHIEEI